MFLVFKWDERHAQKLSTFTLYTSISPQERKWNSNVLSRCHRTFSNVTSTGLIRGKKRTVQIEAKTNGSVPALTDETLLSEYPPI